jgi:hypothetical protein
MIDLATAKALLDRGLLQPSSMLAIITELEQHRERKGVTLELWPFAVSPKEPDTGIYLISGVGPWVTEPLPISPRVWDYAEFELMRRGALAGKVWLHGTSTRDLGAVQVVTMSALIKCPDFVRYSWPDAQPVDPSLHGEVGKPPTHGAGDAPTVRQIDVNFHALRVLTAQLDRRSPHYDATTEADLAKAGILGLVKRYTRPHKAALYAMWDQPHTDQAHEVA